MAPARKKLATFVWAAAVAFAIALLPQGLWSALIILNLKVSPAVPWAVVAVVGLLWLMWRYLGGAFPPRRTSDARRRHLRAALVPWSSFRWALLAGGLSMVALTGYWIVLAQFTRMPGSVLPTMNNVPRPMIAVAVATGAAISPLCEQIGIWGYAQVMLQRDFTRRVAIVLSALIFALAPHPPFGVPLLPKVAFFFLVGMPFAVIANVTGSILPNLPIHMLGLLAFFTIVWPQDPRRPLVWEGGANGWFLLHVGQAIVFTVLAIMGFMRLERAQERVR